MVLNCPARSHTRDSSSKVAARQFLRQPSIRIGRSWDVQPAVIITSRYSRARSLSVLLAWTREPRLKGGFIGSAWAAETWNVWHAFSKRCVEAAKMDGENFLFGRPCVLLSCFALLAAALSALLHVLGMESLRSDPASYVSTAYG
jgi:hypothetical protein